MPDPAAGTPPLMEAVVDTVREPLLLLDAETRVRLANRSFLRTFRVEPAEVLGRPLARLGDGPWSGPALAALLDALAREGRAFEDHEVAHDFPRVGRRVMLLNARPVRQDADAAPLILLAFEDVTERRRAEEELLRSNKELEQFAYVASHDLQEPLRMVVSFTELLSQRYAGKLGPDADEFIGYAVDGARRMQRLINDLLDYSRAGRRGEPRRLNAGAPLGGALSALRLAVEESRARVEVGEMPEVLGDPVQLVQLFQNLLGNALKFRHPERAPLVRVRATRAGPFWSFRVEDNGIGIEPRYFEKVFIIFERLHGAEVPGTGIGLPLCRRIVMRHGGRMWIESEIGRGTALCFTLPVPGEGL